MREIIAEIRLAPGEVGYYDDYSRVYLSTTHPTAKIYAGMNTTQIRKSIRSGRLRLISGSLFGPAPDKKVEAKAPEIKEEPKQEAKVEEPKVEEPKVEAPIEEPVEAPVEEAEELKEEASAEVEPAEEEKPKRRRRKKADAE